MTALFAAALAAALPHITPTVVLVSKADAVRQIVPNAQTFTAREVHLSEADAQRLHGAVDWSPENGVLTFYSGKRGAQVLGTFLFVRVDSPHGPVEVAVGFGPQRTVRKVIVTKATVETKPWVQEVLEAGLLAHYEGLEPGASPAAASQVATEVGKMPAYMAEQIDTGVARALAAYAAFAA